MAIPTLKTGWLLRQSTILKRWKRNWFVLYGDGNLTYYENDDLREKEGNFCVPINCKGVKSALECDVAPPEDRNYGCLLKLLSKDHNHVVVCAFNSDEALAWKMMVEQFIAVNRPVVNQPLPPQATVTRYTTYPNTVTTIRRSSSYPNIRRTTTTAYPVQQNVPVYYYPNHGPLVVQYDAYGRPYYVHPQTQVITVIREDDPYYYRSGDLMWGMAAGAMLGAALYTPFLFF